MIVRLYKIPSIHTLISLGLMILFILSPYNNAHAYKSIISDVRMKTFIYNEANIYDAKFHYKILSYVEFPNGEIITEIGVGESAGWQFIPKKNKLYIKPSLISNATNLVISTNKGRTYRFDIDSSSVANFKDDAEISYGIRFYYPPRKSVDLPRIKVLEPEINKKEIQNEIKGGLKLQKNYNNTGNYTPPQTNNPNFTNNSFPNRPYQGNNSVNSADFRDPLIQKVIESDTETGNSKADIFNFDYSFIGPDNSSITPVKVFDNSRSTFLEFSGSAKPNVFFINVDGTETPADIIEITDTAIEIPNVVWQFTLRDPFSDNVICIFNERLNTAQ